MNPLAAYGSGDIDINRLIQSLPGGAGAPVDMDRFLDSLVRGLPGGSLLTFGGSPKGRKQAGGFGTAGRGAQQAGSFSWLPVLQQLLSFNPRSTPLAGARSHG